MAKIDIKRLILSNGFYIELPSRSPEVEVKYHECDVGYTRSESVIPDTMNPQIAYLLGFMRDGSISGSLVEIKQQSSNELLEEVISPIIRENFNKYVTTKKGRIIFKDKKIASFLRNSGNHKKGCWDTPKVIKWCPQEIVKWYIRGFWDAEGGCPHISNYIYKRKKVPVMITIVQCWDNIRECPPLDFIKRNLEELGVGSKLYPLSKKEVYRKYPRFRLSITSYRNIILFNDVIGSSHPRKGRDLMILSDSLRPLVAA